MNKHILITGANGFVGSELTKKLHGNDLKLLGRTASKFDAYPFCKAEINQSSDYSVFLNDVDVIIHAAARAHIMDDTSSDPTAAYTAVNTLGTVNLAKQAAAAGVKRFIFISSIKVNGEATNFERPFTFNDMAAPEDPYGFSKAEAEAGLRSISAETGMEVVIIRPPLVYGPGVKANFAAMMKMASKGIPLPLGAINNKRSLVALENLVDLIVTCIDHPNAANQTFLVSDDNDVSTTELLKMMTKAAGKNPVLLPVPVSWLKFAGKITGKQAVIERLCGNLQVDISHTKNTLGWTPPITTEEGIKRCFEKEVSN